MKTTIPAADVIIFEKMPCKLLWRGDFYKISSKHKDFSNYDEKKSGRDRDGSVRLE